MQVWTPRHSEFWLYLLPVFLRKPISSSVHGQLFLNAREPSPPELHGAPRIRHEVKLGKTPRD